MPKRYFALRQNLYVPERWYLDEPTDSQGREVEDIWQFTEGRPLQIEERLRVPLYRPGKPLEFSTTGAATSPIVHQKVGAVFAELAPQDVQLIPAEVEGQSEPHFILVATRLIHCIDDSACEQVLHWKPEDGQPDKVGQYRGVVGLRIDKAQVGDAQVFRPWGWTVALIVSEALKDALERTKATGLQFTEV